MTKKTFNYRSALGAIIESLKDDLEQYAKRSDAKEYIIGKNNLRIKNLIESYNSLPDYKFIDTFQKVEFELENIQEKFPELTGAIIIIPFGIKDVDFNKIARIEIC